MHRCTNFMALLCFVAGCSLTSPAQNPAKHGTTTGGTGSSSGAGGTTGTTTGSTTGANATSGDGSTSGTGSTGSSAGGSTSTTGSTGSSPTSGGSTGSVTYIPLAPMSGFPGSAAPVAKYQDSFVVDSNETQIVKDVLGPNLIGFMADSASGNVSAFISKDRGSTWSWVSTGVKLTAASGWTTDATITAITQDAAGNIHIICDQTFAPSIYYRIGLSRDASSNINGFTLQAGFTIAPSADVASSNHGHLVAGTDLSNNPVLFYAVLDYNGNAWIGKSSQGYSPLANSDFTSLDGTSATTEIATGSAGSHNDNMDMALHPISRDLWMQWGAMDTSDSDTSPMPLVRRRYVPGAGSTWATTSSTPDVTVYQGGLPNAQALKMVTTPNYVWFLRGGGAGGTAAPGVTGGMFIDSADKNGTVIYGALPKVASSDYLGWYGLSVDPVTENRAYVAGWISSASGPSADKNGILLKYWNGTTWQDLSSQETTRFSDTLGMGFSSGWGSGLGIFFIGDSGSMVPEIATMQGN